MGPLDRENAVKTDQMLDDIREANLTYLILAQRLIREDRAEAMFRLGIGEEVADRSPSSRLRRS